MFQLSGGGARTRKENLGLGNAGSGFLLLCSMMCTYNVLTEYSTVSCNYKLQNLPTGCILLLKRKTKKADGTQKSHCFGIE